MAKKQVKLKFQPGDRVIRKNIRSDGARSESTSSNPIPEGTPATIIEQILDLRWRVKLDNGWDGHWWWEDNMELEITDEELNKKLMEAKKDLTTWLQTT